jgi:hypothetical protein
MENRETPESRVLRLLAGKMRMSAAETELPWFSVKMLASALELENQATSLELPH